MPDQPTSIRCLIVIGTRPEAIKLVPVVLALRASRGIIPFVVTTGQHEHLVDPILRLAGITADASFDIGRPGMTINEIARSVMANVENLLDELRSGPERRTRPRLTSPFAKGEARFPGFALVHGDTTSALAAGLAASYARLPVFHLEAGLRTGDRNSPFPEELNRTLLAGIASFHLSPTHTNKETLIHEGVTPSTVMVTGNTGIDALQWAASLEVPWTDPRLAALEDGRQIIVVTAHRRENWGLGIAGIVEGVARIAHARPDVTIVVPMHPNPIVRTPIEAGLSGFDNIVLTDAIDYVEFARLLKMATIAITDSGGIQEEGPSVGTPVLVTRNTTERPEGVLAGTLKLVGTDPTLIAETALALLDDSLEYQQMKQATNPFGDGHAAERIVQAFEHLAYDTPPPVQFGPGFSRESVLADAGYERFDELVTELAPTEDVIR
ncbi:MAG: UDP-N-acetylglucosamine 2-epimerase (non-hydrolyzing) [Candidatus Nanopelagicales bacterium]|nr:UDP-N-acetylglucosamine 2-epimerase (non-hydrolyzing) [Candidatus Nanopelagicales bacterium]